MVERCENAGKYLGPINDAHQASSCASRAELQNPPRNLHLHLARKNADRQVHHHPADLFSRLSGTLTTSWQIDIMFGSLKNDIRGKLRREEITMFEELLGPQGTNRGIFPTGSKTPRTRDNSRTRRCLAPYRQKKSIATGATLPGYSEETVPNVIETLGLTRTSTSTS
jgi:hypothetical protein